MHTWDRQRILNSRFMDEEVKSILRHLTEKVDRIADKADKTFDMLARVEDRQIKTTRLVKEIEEHSTPTIGSFASTEPAKEEGQK